jgi:hypothetical protein
MSQWEHVASFDSAQQCESFRLSNFEAMNRAIANEHFDLSNPVDQLRSLQLVTTVDQQCVSSDDPRLK